jgi:hypothetical protein
VTSSPRPPLISVLLLARSLNAHGVDNLLLGGTYSPPRVTGAQQPAN